MLRSLKIFLLLIVFVGCATYYETTFKFNQAFEEGDLQTAEAALDGIKKSETGKDRLLFFLNKGTVLSLQGKYEESNAYFEKAYLYGEDYRAKAGQIAASILINPMVKDYPGEDHEHLMLLYYKALNYVKMEQYEEALVECRRMNIRLNRLGDKYKSDLKLKRNAFVNNLMGIIYDASKDYNNAYIAYKNAFDIYDKEYTDLFDFKVPTQLKLDIIRTAYKSGFQQEARAYEKRWGLKYNKNKDTGNYLMFIWNDGLGPVKSEWGITFALSQGSGGMVNFHSDEVNASFAYNIYDYGYNDSDKRGLEKVEFIRVVFPKYIERELYFSGGTLEMGANQYPLDKAEDVNSIAFKSLEQRMLKEFGEALLRVAIKKAAEHAVREEDQGWGTALGVFNALTEKADTRNWQTIPHTILYKRVPLEEGDNSLVFKTYVGPNRLEGSAYELNYSIKKNQTIFHSFTSLEHQPIGRINR